MTDHDLESAEIGRWFRENAERTERRLDELEQTLGRKLAVRGAARPREGHSVSLRAAQAACAAAALFALAAFASGYLLARFR